MTSLTLWLKRLSDSVVPVVVMAGFMIMSMSLLSAATENSSQFGRMHLVLVVINGLGLIILVGLIGVNLIRLARQYRRNAAGSRLTMRLVVIFIFLSVVPVTFVYYFSLGFLQKGIDSWFDVRMDQAMDDSLKLSRAALDLYMREQLKRARGMGQSLLGVPNDEVLIILNDLRVNNGANELTLLKNSGEIIASSSEDTTAIIPNRPDDSVMVQVRDSKSFADVAPVGDMGLHVRVAVSIAAPDSEDRVLYVLFPIAERIGELTDGMEVTFAQYKKQMFLREPLKNSFILTLSLVLLVSTLTAVWAALFSAQRLMAPIRILAIGTRAVAAGIYDKKLPPGNNDELGELVSSFSEMTHKLAIARDEAEQSRLEVDRERAYLRAVLGRLSSGVITMDHQFNLRVVNTSASQILEVDMEHALGKHLQAVIELAPNLDEFVQVLTSKLSQEDKEWREEVLFVRKGGNKTLMCQGAPLPSVQGLKPGYVVVFDDVTNLVKAQRDAAWGDVARRLAHEIKNPLTPIQLSAERLRRKYLDKMPPEDRELLDRSTHTIVEQVESMKAMVKAFSDYARTPGLETQAIQFETIVAEVLDLYRGEDSAIRIDTVFDPDLPLIDADPGRVRQLLHNLIKNSIESTLQCEEPAVEISLKRILAHEQAGYLELQVHDNGPGIPEDMLGQLFEPYTTTKYKGGGLGLAVVKRIVEEHNWNVFAENNVEGGASIIVRMPVDERLQNSPEQIVS
ncbi:MAG: ATP-binding protein [Gammaproteobacteria bacterium]|nr:ATP-binding protein [Gammaproteobacteria bacterium]